MMRSSQTPDGPGLLVQRWSWTQFGFAFVICGFVAFLSIGTLTDGFWLHLTKTLVIAIASAWTAGRFGDRAWEAIVRFLSWV